MEFFAACGVGVMLGCLTIIFDRTEISKLHGRAKRKSKKISAFLQQLSLQDKKMQLELLSKKTRETFTLFHACWSARNFAPLEKLMTPDLYQTYSELANNMINKNEINKRPRLGINYIDFVDASSGSFTVLITATKVDFFVDARDPRIFLRGNVDPMQFQEYWQFAWSEFGWQLQKIYQDHQYHLDD